MKRILTALFLIIYAQIAYSQCNTYYLLKEDAKWEMDIYNHKGKLDGKQLNEVSGFEELDNGWIATIKSTYLDKKGKEAFASEFKMECEDGKMKFDMSQMMPQSSVEGFKNMNMEMKGDFLELPTNLEVGQVLNDGNLTFSGDMPFDMSFRIYDRKVVGKETVTVPAGTFDCYKIEYSTEMKSVMNMEAKGVEYVAEKVGVVKQESYNKNGKLTGYSELSSYSF